MAKIAKNTPKTTKSVSKEKLPLNEARLQSVLETFYIEPKKDDGKETRDMNETMLKNVPEYNGVRACWVPLSQIRFPQGDKDYTRSCGKRALQMAMTWNPAKCDFVKLFYDHQRGKFMVIDGKRRIAAAAAIGDVAINASVYTDMKIVQAAGLFAHQGRDRVSPTPVEELKAAVIAEEPWALDFENLCERFSLSVSARPGVNKVQCVRKIQKLMETPFGVKGVTDVFVALSKNGWIDQPLGTSARIVTAIANFFMEMDKAGKRRNVSIGRLCAITDGFTPSEMISRAMEVMSGEKIVTKALAKYFTAMA